MRLSKSDFIFLGLSSVILTVSSVLLYFDFNKKIEVTGVEKIGTITFKRQVAQRRYDSQVVWEDVQQNVPVYNNDYIRTSEASEAVLHLQDGSEINIDEVSMIQISLEDGKGVNINFDHGTISANRSNMGGRKPSAIKIKSKTSSIAFKDGDIQLSQKEGEKLDLTVSKGSATVATEMGETVVNTNEKALIDSQSRTEIVKLNFNLQSPPMNKRLFSSIKKTEVAFQWTTSGELAKYRIEVSKKRNFGKIWAHGNTGRGANWRRHFKQGTYFWRVSAINQNSGKREFSEPFKFNVIYRPRPKLISPSPGHVFQNGELAVNFKWEKDFFAKSYTVELSTSPEFDSIFKTISTKRSNIFIPKIAQGKYFWRVKRSMESQGEDLVDYSITRSFSVSMVQELPAPVVMLPKKKSKINLLDLTSSGMVFSWSGSPQFKKFILEIARDSEFSQIIKSFDVSGKYKLVKEKLSPGQYYCRVRASLKGARVPDSVITPFEIVSDVDVKLLGGEKKSFFVEEGESHKVVFSWGSNLRNGQFRLDISRDPLFSNKQSHFVSGKSSKTLELSQAGEYYWRVVTLDGNKRAVATSKTGSLNLEFKKQRSEAQKATIVVRSPVKKSKIFINSKFIGYSFAERKVEASKSLNIVIKTRGFKNYNKVVTLKPGETFNLKPVLVKKTLLSRVQWVNNLKAPMAAKPVYRQGKLVVATQKGEFKVLSRSGKTFVRKLFSSGFESAPVVRGNRVFIVDVAGLLRSIDMSTGEVLWKAQLSGPLIFGSKPVIHGKYIYIANGYGGVECLDLQGKTQWKKELYDSIYSSPKVFGDKLLVVTGAPEIICFDLDYGNIDWRRKLQGRLIGTAPRLWKKTIFFGTDSGFLYSMDPDDGRLNWKFKANGVLQATPIIVGKSVIFGSSKGVIYSLDVANGKEIWKVSLNKRIKGSPGFALGEIILHDSNTVYSLSPNNGELLWKKNFGVKIKTSPVVVDNTLIVGLVNGDVVSLRGSLVQTVK